MVTILKTVLFSLLLLASFHGISLADTLAADRNGALGGVDARAVISTEKGLLLATREALYKNSAEIEGWKQIFALPAGDNEIQSMGASEGIICLGTKKGLYISNDDGSSWTLQFKTIIPGKNDIKAVLVSGDGSILIGTKRGIYTSADNGLSWSDISGSLKNAGVGCIARGGGHIYTGTEQGFYIGDISGRWERVLVSYPEGEGDYPEDAEGSDDYEQEGHDPISCVYTGKDALYVGMRKGILLSRDGGKRWQHMPSKGLAGYVNYLILSRGENNLYCATTKGVFELVRGSEAWNEIYKGAKRSMDVRFLTRDYTEDQTLWAATDDGLYRLKISDHDMAGYKDMEDILRRARSSLDDDVPFEELRQAAIRYAEVGPEKISSWRRESRLRALLPKVSVSFDKARSTNSEIYTSATKDYIVVGPEDITDGFDVSVSWELGDIIWSDDQTNIDVRSRLMVQLRNDILDDLRRIYYERKRLKFELISETARDAKARYEKEMRIEELTQAINDLTGNYLSERSGRAARL